MNDDCCYKLYMHVNKINGKVYIGQTKKSYCERWHNGKGYGHCSRFAKAIKKYGWDGFEHIPLIEGLTRSEADYFECFFINFFDAQNPEFGYNLTAGGDECPLDDPVVRENHREAMKKVYADTEWRRKHREAMKKMHADPEYQKNLREGVKKRSADPEYQKNHREAMKKMHADPEWRRKQREAMEKVHADPEYQKNLREGVKKRSADPEWRENVRKANKKRSKKVLCIETKIVYDSLTEATVAVNLKSPTCISQCCNGKRKTAGGYHWEYA